MIDRLVEVTLPHTGEALDPDGDVAAAQSQATRSLPTAHWWGAGRADVLVVQPDDDVIALAANAEAIADELGSRASMVTVPHVGHALLPEQPEAVASAVLEWLRRRGR